MYVSWCFSSAISVCFVVKSNPRIPAPHLGHNGHPKEELCKESCPILSSTCPQIGAFHGISHSWSILNCSHCGTPQPIRSQIPTMAKWLERSSGSPRTSGTHLRNDLQRWCVHLLTFRSSPHRPKLGRVFFEAASVEARPVVEDVESYSYTYQILPIESPK